MKDKEFAVERIRSQYVQTEHTELDELKACVVHPSGILGPNDHAIGETTGTLLQIIKGERVEQTRERLSRK